MEEPIVMNELVIRMMQNYTDCIIREGTADLPYAPAADTVTEQVDEGDLPALTAQMLQWTERGHVLISVCSQRTYKVACALNETSEGNHMAIYYKGDWSAGDFLKEIRYEDSLLTDENGGEYCIAKCLYQDEVFADLNGRILLRGEKEVTPASLLLRKKRDSSEWGRMLLDEAFSESRFTGRLTELPNALGKRAVVLYDLLRRIGLRNDNQQPVLDRVLVFEGGETIVLEWRHPLSRGFQIDDFCFSVLFGTERAACTDVTGTIIKGILSSAALPDHFLSELERVFLLGRASTQERWEAALLRMKIDLEDVPERTERRAI